MGKNNIAGAWGEGVAWEYLRKKQYKLVATNYRTKFGEIDLIVSNKPVTSLDYLESRLGFTYAALTEDQDTFDRDGVIWCVHIDRMNKQLPPFLSGMLEKERGNIFTMEMLDRIGDGFDALRAISSKPYALFFEPASAVNRIANQYALFSLCSDPVTPINALPETENCFYRIIIPASVKLEIRDKLDYINISERMIYPGLDGICKWITRRYAALGPKYHREPEKE